MNLIDKLVRFRKEIAGKVYTGQAIIIRETSSGCQGDWMAIQKQGGNAGPVTLDNEDIIEVLPDPKPHPEIKPPC